MSQQDFESGPNNDDAMRLQEIVNPSTEELIKRVDDCLLLRNFSTETDRTEQLKRDGEEYLQALETMLSEKHHNADWRAVITSEINKAEEQLQRLGWERKPGEPRGIPSGEPYIHTKELPGNN